MIVESVKIVADALADATIGVNAQIPTVPRFAGHDQPPNVKNVLTIFDDERTASEEDPADWPALIVTVGTPWSLDGFPLTDNLQGRGGGVSVLYYTRKPDYEVALRDGYYTIRAALWTLVDLFDPGRAGSEADRVQNGIQLEALTGHTMGLTGRRLDSGAVTARLDSQFQARELLP